MEIKTKYNIGDNVWTSVYIKGWYYTIPYTIKYIKIERCKNKYIIKYGFVYEIEVEEKDCFITETEALHETEHRNEVL